MNNAILDFSFRLKKHCYIFLLKQTEDRQFPATHQRNTDCGRARNEERRAKSLRETGGRQRHAVRHRLHQGKLQ